MSLALRAKNITSKVLLLSRMPDKYAFIFHDHKIDHCNLETDCASLNFADFDALLVVDTGTWSQLPNLKDRLSALKGPKLVLDHHLTQENWADIKLVDPTAAAAGEIVAELLKHWQIPFDPAIATALFLAIASDTGWFQFSNTRPHTMRLAADLMESGAQTERIYRLIYQNERIQRLELQTLAQKSLELFKDNRLAVMTLRRSDFQASGADMTDTENLINIPLQVQSVEVAMLIVEPTDSSPIRISLRSKNSLDVARFAEQFGGGGHARAAGLKIPGPLEEIRQKIVQSLISNMSH
jgi:bifunctional oligoribonuclease and PAP phosphatase NrnA